MDDLVAGDHSINKAKQTIKRVKQAIDFRKFWLKKRTASNTVLLKEISEEDRESKKAAYNDINL
jgi:hypothetical protein